MHLTLAHCYDENSRRVFATLVRVLGDFDLAEDALQDAFMEAASRWEHEGAPDNPIAWLVSVGRFKAIDRLRRQAKLGELAPDLAARLESLERTNQTRSRYPIQDDRLRLIFTCCHPAIDHQVRVPLTLREVCGLTTEEIASAFLIPSATMAQRIVRGKAKIRDAKIPIVVPDRDELPERLSTVLEVIYLIFNEGYAASRGEDHIRSDLSGEAIRLCRLLREMIDDVEVQGLLALMLLHESRREARVNSEGDIILLEDQDRILWNKHLIEEGTQLVENALRAGGFGPYTLQAAISAVHANAESYKATDWNQIVALYDLLQQFVAGPVVRLNRAVAVAMAEGPEAGLALIDELLSAGHLGNYMLAHSARGELLRRLGRIDDARAALERARELTQQTSEQRFLDNKLKELAN